MIVVYVVVKIFTGLNKIENQGQSQTLAVSTKPVIERNFSNDELIILTRNSTKTVQTSDLKYLDYDKMEGNSNQALILSQKIKSVNSNIDSVPTQLLFPKHYKSEQVTSLTGSLDLAVKPAVLPEVGVGVQTSFQL